MLDIDDIIVDTLKKSSESILQTFDIKPPGSKNQINTSSRSILIGIDKDTPETIGDDFDELRETYAILVNIQKVDYRKAKEQLRAVKKAIMKTLHKDLDEEYSEYMKYEGSDYGYDEDSFIRTIDIRVSFLVDEFYGEDLDEIDDIKVRGDLID